MAVALRSVSPEANTTADPCWRVVAFLYLRRYAVPVISSVRYRWSFASGGSTATPLVQEDRFND
jgi:hypothetical protein